ncbi:MAG: alpha/beta-type small acid-soluble spore protein [Defluviitaleaceae bacterium]|nr:alpha/beta-type small acid-soluble spore protein [Defluviitaleaceae bacterium]
MKIKTPAEIARERMKYEIAGELGLLDKVYDMGWKSLTAREAGRIGGIMAKRERDDRNAASKE